MALAYVLTGQTNYALSVRKKLLSEARDYMAHYEKLDIKAEPEWARWNWWGATAWAYDLAYDAFPQEESAEIERWFRIRSDPFRRITALPDRGWARGSPSPRWRVRSWTGVGENPM